MENSKSSFGKHCTWGAILFALIVLVVHSIMIHPWMLDDSFISFRYAENFVAGHGLVYNQGERVEGYTTFLWVIVLSLGEILKINLVMFSKIAGYVFTLGTILLTAFSFRFSQLITRQQAAIATVVLGSCGVFTAWAGSGMETSMFTFSVLLTVLAYVAVIEQGVDQQPLAVAGMIAGATALIRPEGVLIFGLLLLHLVLVNKNARFKSAALFAVSFGCIYGVYFLWRFNYYGFLFPNSYYAKVGSGIVQVVRGLQYFGKFVWSISLILIPLIVVLLTKKWNREYLPLVIVPIILVAYMVYIVRVGGDIMPAYRFFTPILPLICLLTAIAVTSLVPSGKIALLIISVSAIVTYNLVHLRFDNEIYTHIKADDVALQGEAVGRWLRESAPPNSIVATNTAGSIPYYSKLRTIDMLGINDAHIAHREIGQMGSGMAGHEKGDGAYVLSKKPDYIIFKSSVGSEKPHPYFISDIEIYRSKEFHSNYELKTLSLDTGETLTYYQKRSPDLDLER